MIIPFGMTNRKITEEEMRTLQKKIISKEVLTEEDSKLLDAILSYMVGKIRIEKFLK